MTRDVQQKVVFTAVFVIALLVLEYNHGWRLLPNFWFAQKPAAAATPQDAIYGMLEAARAGDTRAYLDYFSGEMHAELLQVIKEDSEPTFATYLKSQNRAFEGVAVSLTNRPSDAEAQVRVEYIYRGHNEVQGVYLRKEPSGWKIVRVANAEQLTTPFPFGTAVTD